MVEIAWATGLFEGEGCIHLRKGYKGVALQMNSTDKDVLERLAQVFGGSIYQISMSKKPSHYKQLYHWSVTKRQDVIPALEKMLPFMGERRACKALDAFDHIEL